MARIGKEPALSHAVCQQRAPQIVASSVVIGELLAGFAVGSHEEKNRDELRQFLASVRVAIVAIDEDTAAFYATVYRNLRARGRPIPTNDSGSRRRRSSTAAPFSATMGIFRRSRDWLLGQLLRNGVFPNCKGYYKQ